MFRRVFNLLLMFIVSFSYFPNGNHVKAESLTTKFTGELEPSKVFHRLQFPHEVGDGDLDYSLIYEPTQLTDIKENSYNYYLQYINPSVSGAYSITVKETTLIKKNTNPDGTIIEKDTALFLYKDSFDPKNPKMNLLKANDDISNGNYLLHIPSIELTADTNYIIVMTSYFADDSGTADFEVTGPGTVTNSSNPISTDTTVLGVDIVESTLSMLTGETAALNVSISPENASNTNLIWSSSDENVVTIEDGNITAVGSGSATITVETEDGRLSDTCLIYVDAPVVTNIYISGHPYVGYFLKGDYEISDIYDVNDDFGQSLLQWYSSNDADNTDKVPIAGANGISYIITPADYGKYISLVVTPIDIFDTKGKPVFSEPQLIKEPSTDSLINTAFEGTLSTTDLFKRPEFPGNGDNPELVFLGDDFNELSAEEYNYYNVNVTPVISGNYMIWVEDTDLIGSDESSVTKDPVLFVYQNTFDPTNPLINLMVGNDDMLSLYRSDWNRALSYIPNLNLEAGKKYTLVLSTYQNGLSGKLKFKGLGPGSLAVTEPNPIRNLKAIAGDKMVSFTFDVPSNATKVELEQSEDGVTWSKAQTESLNSLSSSAVATELENDVTYYFRLVITDGERSGFSNIVKVSLDREQAAPTGLSGNAPTVLGNDGQITGASLEMEYKLKTDLIWILVTGTTITGLVAGTYEVRYAAKEGYNAGTSVEVVVPAYVAPPNQEQTAPTGLSEVAPTVLGNDGQITDTSSEMEYKLKTDLIWIPVTGSTITGLVAGTYEVRYAAKEGYNAGTSVEVVVPAYVTPPNQEQTAPTGLSGVAPTVLGNDGQITDTSSEMEYKLKTDLIWIPVTGTTITGLVAGTYEVRYAAKEGYNAGTSVEVVVPAYVAPPNQEQTAPTGLSGNAPTVLGNDGQITGASSEMEYKLKTDSTWIPVTGTTITGLVAGTYEVRYAAKEGYNAGTPAEIIVPAYVAPPNQEQTAPTGLSGNAPTVLGNDGQITGTSSEMEYKLKTDSTWIPVTGTTITGLATGTYEVRYAAKEGYNAGTSVEVVVPAYVAPPNQEQTAPTGLSEVSPTVLGNDGQITDTSSEMEYKLKTDLIWIPVTGSTITGLVAGTYEVRYAAKEGYNAGTSVEINVPAYVAPPNQGQTAPTGLSGVAPTVLGNDGQITDTSSEMEYKLKTDSTWIPVTGTTITGLVAGTYEVRYAAKEGYNAGTPAEIIVPAYVAPPNQEQTAPTGLSGVAPTVLGNDGQITDTSSEMEYKLKTDSTWIPVTGTTITGLVAGTYEVRYKTKSGYNAGQIKEVVVPQYIAATPDPEGNNNGGGNTTTPSGNTGGEPNSKPSGTTRPADVGVSDGNKSESTAKVEIVRQSENNKKVDQVVLDNKTTEDTLKKALEQKKDTVNISISDIPNDLADEVSVKIPKQSIGQLSGSNVALNIQTEDVSIQLPKESVQGLNGKADDLFFRVVPIRKEDEKKEVISNTLNASVVKEVAGENDVQILGKPMTIETNYQNQKTLVTFSLKEIALPTDITEREAFINSLAVFIQHSDGEKVVNKGKIKYDANGKPVGIEIEITKFSTFTIISVTDKTETKTHTPYIQGFGKQFKPTEVVTRKQMAAMLARNLPDQTINQGIKGYTDLNKNNWAYADIMKAKNAGIMLGVTETKFNPGGAVTRAQMAVIAYRYIQKECVKDSKAFESCDSLSKIDSAGYKDVSSKYWAQEAISFMKIANIMTGFDGNTFKPEDKLTRAQAVKVLNRLFKRGPLNGVETSTFPDVPTSHWAFKEIEEAARYHQYKHEANEEWLVEK
ncbi:S-layer homology domain-containing protein [Bacillus sp. CGMCC 1.16607]|uniref:S-layer homology domain-containing protein n=1 Tax=Bacillus sp. CGMCC 1.16607 TaxID=3351842 RepID=UPI00362EDA3C